MQIRVFDLLKLATDKSKTEFITLNNLFNKERKIIQIKLHQFEYVLLERRLKAKRKRKFDCTGI